MKNRQSLTVIHNIVCKSVGVVLYTDLTRLGALWIKSTRCFEVSFLVLEGCNSCFLTQVRFRL